MIGGTAEIELEFNAGMLEIGNKIIQKLGKFSPAIWEEVEASVLSHAETVNAEILSNKASKATIHWRSEWSKKGKQVETYNGVEDPVVASTRVGERTGVFLGDFGTSAEPAVTYGIENYEGIGSVINGGFRYSIHPGEFADSYPSIFEEWLQGKGMLPADGFLGLDESERAMVLKKLENAVWREIKTELGAVGGAAQIGNTIIVNAKKLIGKFFKKIIR